MPTLYRVTLPVHDLAVALRFYRTLFAEDGDSLGPDWHSFRFGGATLLCHQVMGTWAVHTEPLYIAVDESLVQVHYRAQSLGTSHVDAELSTLPTGERAFLMRDPFGNMLYIVDTRTVPWHMYGGLRAIAPAETAEPVAAREAVDSMTLALQRDFISAVKGGDLEVVQDLLQIDPELIAATNAAGISALMLGAYKQQQAVVAYLLEQDPELNVWEAAAFGRAARLARLLDLDPRPSVYSADGFTPLGLACFFGHPECVQLLLRRGAEPNAPSRNDMQVRPLHSALARAPDDAALENARALIAAGANVNATQQGGYTPLHQAADRGLEAVVRLLLEAGARPDTRADNRRTPAQMARVKGHAQIAALLG